MQTFGNGATRTDSDNKLDPEGFLSPAALHCYFEYMHGHRKQADGKIRASDNWQRGVPVWAYMKSLMRHTFDVWSLHRGCTVLDRDDGHEITREEALCGVIFNALGQLHELVKGREVVEPIKTGTLDLPGDEEWLK